MKNTWYLFLPATLGLTGLSFSLPTQAENLVLEEVVVTARKRAESLQEVPVAVTAFSTETMESLGIKNMHDIDGLVPGLNLGAGNGVKGDGNAYIRGVGQRETRVVRGARGRYLASENTRGDPSDRACHAR